MLADADTVTEGDSAHEESAEELWLEWVWPRRRSDRLRGASLIIGRDDAAPIQLDGASVSRRHAELYRQGPLYVIRDLGSRNGTWLDGRHTQHGPLGAGAVLRIGDWIALLTQRDSAKPRVEFGEVLPGIFGGHELATLVPTLQRAARSDIPIVIVGETGTGKELFARAVHRSSGRVGPFLAVNCAALPEHLAEAELFGYRRGAFTGAERANDGLFRAADGGTLFLDEMPELSLSLQAKLLRALEYGEVHSLGATAPVRVDVRVVAASQTTVADLVSAKRLREDLAGRLSGLELRLSSLAQRRTDIVPLFAKFLEIKSGGRAPELDPRLVEALCLHDWPFNVRGLQLLAHALLAVHGHEPHLKRRHLPPEVAELVEGRPTSRLDQPASTRQSAAGGRRQHDIARLDSELKKNGGNVKAAARAIGISRQRVYRLLGERVVAQEEPGKLQDGIAD